ncbi:MAG: M24 family metallopeptidase [Desulfitobacteriia bacterium]|jgi:Xaa-Pro aminopeptidase
MTEIFHERFKSPIPTAELQRRWQKTQKAMKEAGIDCILTQNTTQYMGGYNRWLTDTTAENAYPQSVIIPAEGEMALIAYGAPPQNYYPPKYVVRGAKVMPNVPYFAPFNFTHDWEGKIAMDWIREHDIKCIGIAGMGLIHSAYYDYLVKNLPGVKFVDASDLLDQIKCIKSEAEIEFIRRSAAIQDKAFGYVGAITQPGVREYEIRGKLMEILTDLGGEEQIVVIGSAPQGETFTPYPSFLQNRTLEDGDQVYIGISSSGPGGFFTAIGRMVSLGRPSVEMKENFELALRAQKKVTAQLEIRADPGIIYAEYNRFLEANNCEPEHALFAYGQGYDYIERPSIQPGETMRIQKDMCLAVNTSIVAARRTSYLCDSFLITAEGPARLHKTAQNIIVA